MLFRRGLFYWLDDFKTFEPTPFFTVCLADDRESAPQGRRLPFVDLPV
jgi:hypothetical protein